MRHIRSLLITLVLVGLIGAAAAYSIYDHYAGDLPGFSQLADYQPPTVSRVHAGDGRLLAEYATEKRVFVPIKAIPPRLKYAILAAEDRDFYTHGGVNPEAIARAMISNLLHVGSGRRAGGASTITQQVAKNMLLGNEYSVARKVKEAILAVRIEEALSKDRILELYMNENYFGAGAYGVAAAALNYFDKSLDDLTIAEAAFIAGALKEPGNYDPAKHYDRVKDRRDYAIDGMAKIGAITEAEARAAMAEPIVLHRRDETEVYQAPFYTEEVRRELVQRFGETAVYKSGLSVRTSLNPVLQTFADKALRDGLEVYDRRHGWRGPVGHVELAAGDAHWQSLLAAQAYPPGGLPWKLAIVREVKPDVASIGLSDGATGTIAMAELFWANPVLDDQRYGPRPKTADQVLKRGDVILVEALKSPGSFGLRQIPNVSGALVALDPHTGRVLAMSGGWSYDMSQFNRATQAKRQIGSTIKPFVYLAALENGMTPSTLIDAAPLVLDQGPGLPKWQPKNFESSEDFGAPPLRIAIERSINTMTVRMASIIGIEKIAPYVERLGIMDTMPPFYSMVLGAGETTPLRLTTAYAMLVNGGKKITPSLIDSVQDRNGQLIFKHDDRACQRCGDYDWTPELADTREQVLDPGTAYQMVNILVGVVQRGTAAGAVGSKFRVPIAGKTGTTNDANEAWFVGFTPDLVAGIYVGFDQPRTLGPHEQGASIAAPIFAEFMGDALKDKPPVDFRIPPGLRMVRVNATTGKLAEPGERNVIWEAFKPGTEPGDEVIEGGAGIETLSGDSGSGTSDAGSGVLVPPGQAVSAETAAKTKPPTAPSTGTGGLY